MFLLLQLSFGSWKLAGLAFVVVPGALAGGAVAAFADGGDLTIGSYAGFLALLALSVRHAMALISGLQARAEQLSDKLDLSDVLVGAQDRVAPVVMTACATALGLLPFLFSSNSFGHEIVAPMAIVILGGLVSSLAVNLFILPALYLQFAPEPETAVGQTQLAISHEEA
jgi:Cu/Ag efflux pump CusA